jgi:steroid 5-alpha reductase family enzyme
LKIIATATYLVIGLLAVAAASYLFGNAPGPAEWDALRSLLLIVAAAWAGCFVLGHWTGNVSQVDKLWSLLPVVYVWVVAANGNGSARLLLMAVLVTMWGLRLTYNFSRHGAYRLKFWQGKEDYRWQVLREKPEFQPAWKWTLFNLLFISGYQNLLILSLTFPAIIALQYDDTPLGLLDGVATALMLAMIVLEAVADNQQWRYQSAKHARVNAGQALTGDFAKGFLDKGLWAYSRHPNYLAEQGVWIAFYLFSVAASGQWINWSMGGCLLLVVLFRSSSSFSEEISAGKYPEYRTYQQHVSRFLPVKFKR